MITFPGCGGGGWQQGASTLNLTGLISGPLFNSKGLFKNVFIFYSNRVEQFVPAGKKKGCLLQEGYLLFTITLGILKKIVRILLLGAVCCCPSLCTKR